MGVEVPDGTFIVASSGSLPATKKAMKESVWVRLWARKNWPYRELVPPSRLYWLELPTQSFVWSSTVSRVAAFPYDDRRDVIAEIDRKFSGDLQISDGEVSAAPDAGYCVAWSVRPDRKLQLERPSSVRLNGFRWMRVSPDSALDRLLATSAEAKTSPAPMGGGGGGFKLGKVYYAPSAG